MKNWLLLISLFIGLNSFTQNLVGNPYFDRDPNKACFDIQYGGWEASWGSTQLAFDICQTKPPSQVLSTVGLNHLPFPYVGTGYMGVIAKSNNFNIIRQFTSTYLMYGLQVGEEYIVEFRYKPWYRNNYFVDRLGVYVGNTPIDNSNYSNYTATVSIQQSITDTTQWLLFSDSFIAKGGETILNIGNFSPDSITTEIPNPPNINKGTLYNARRWPLIFIDAVFLYKATDTLYTVTLPQDTLLCPGETLDLVAVLDSGFKLQDTVTTYLWSTGSTDSIITVTQPGTYWVQSTINKRFVQADTIVVTYFDANYTLGLPDSIGFCENEDANLLANLIPLTKYYWSNGDTTRGISIGYATTLQLTAVTPCYTLQESVTIYQKQCEVYIYIPNAFTPNGDGNNDYFEFYGVPEPVSLLVFDRWGGIVYQNPNYKNDWDGTSLNGDTLPTGVYTYLIEYKYISPKATIPDPKGSDRQIRGTVTIIR